MVSPPVVGLILISLIGGLSEVITTHQPHLFTHSSLSSIPSSRPCPSYWAHCNKDTHHSPNQRNSKDDTSVNLRGLDAANRTDDGLRTAHSMARNTFSRRLRKGPPKNTKQLSKPVARELQLSKMSRIQKASSRTRNTFNPRAVSSLESLLNSLLRNKNYRVTLSVDASKKDNYFVKLFENLPNVSSSSNARSSNSSSKEQVINDSKYVSESGVRRPSSASTKISLKNSVYLSDFTRRPSVKPSNKTRVSVLAFKENVKTRHSQTGKELVFVTIDPLVNVSNNFTSSALGFTLQTHKSRRSGRNFAIEDDRKKENNHTGVMEALFPNKTILNRLADKAKTFNDLFNYTYQISAIERGSLFPHDPFPDADKQFGKRSSFISPYISPNIGSQSSSSDTVSVTKNPSVYNSLRPRLRTTQSSRTKTTFGQRTNSISSSTSYIQSNNTTPRTRLRVKMLLTENRDARPVNSNLTLVTDSSSSDELKRDSSVILPKRIVSSFACAFDMEPRRRTTNIPTNQIVSNTSLSDIPLRAVVQEGNGTKQLTKSYRYSIGRSRQNNSANRSSLLPKLRIHKTEAPASEPDTSTLTDFTEVTTEPSVASQTLLRKISETLKRLNSSSVDSRALSGETGMMAKHLESEIIRQPKMTDTENSENDAVKKPKLDPKAFYDYLLKASTGGGMYNFSLPEYRPGSFFRYDSVYPRKPVLDMAYTRPPPFFKVRVTTRTPVIETTETPTTFESLRTSVRVSSTFYPNRMQDVTMRFGNINEPPTTLPPKEGEGDESELRDAAAEPGFTMEKLAYLLIGTCCGLSILCLCVVVIAIKCRRHLVEKRLKAHLQRRLYKQDSPWRQQMLDHFVYLHGQPDNQSRSSANSCSCRCVTWSLGARNLDGCRPLCPSNNSRNSLYLCGQKKLPFGAASTLRYESMLGRKSPTGPCRNESQNSDSSHENDSLEQGSESRGRDSAGSRHCTCINYTVWPSPMRGMYGLCPSAGHYVAGDCSYHSPEDIGAMPRNCPPPVTGSNYLDRSEGVVYWSSNDERLI
ncbi:uncharacterized protein CDAR_125741 [Caerostris darwini]|uniref:Uncharacterized protein n=1 Tax=Caerostris darwini TaxID=1538125 RepID=A0AAV4TPJ7_9ARAC|nr:uncharacterized protein CDAR_125741 [Caerostris darwini]